MNSKLPTNITKVIVKRHQVAEQHRHPFKKKLFYGLSNFISNPESFELTLTRQGQADGITEIWHDFVMWIRANDQWQRSVNLLKRTTSTQQQQAVYQTRAKKIKYQDKLIGLINQGFVVSLLVNEKPIK